MSLCLNNCGTAMVEHDYNECKPIFLGNSYSVGFILCKEANDDLKVDYTASGAWNTILTGSNPENDVVIADGVVVGLTSEITTTDNPYKNGEDTVKSGETFTLSIVDPNVSVDNFEFYKSIDRKPVWIVIAFEDGRMWVTEEQIRVHFKTPQIENGTAQSFTLEGSRLFKNGTGLLAFTSQPAGVFTY